METFGIILLAGFLIYLAWRILIAYLEYRHFLDTPAACWREEVLTRARVLSSEFKAMQAELAPLQKKWSADQDEILKPIVQRVLSTMSVDVLLAYPGIGPATIDKLHLSGLKRMDQLNEEHISVPGIGPKRLADLKKAIASTHQDAIQQLSVGGDAQAKEAIAEFHRRHSGTAARMAALQQRLMKLSITMRDSVHLVEIADRITFLGYLRHEPVPELTTTLLTTPLDHLMPLPSATSTYEPKFVDPQPPAAKPTAYSTPPAREPTPKGKPVVAHGKQDDLFRAALESTSTKAAPVRQDHPRLPHLRLTAEFGIALARADGKIAQAERKAIRDYLQATFGHEVELLPRIDPLLEAAEKKPRGFDECLLLLEGLFDRKERQALYAFACAVADASGPRNLKEKQYLERIVAAWGVVPAIEQKTVSPEPKPTPTAKPPTPPSREENLATLEIERGSTVTAEQIRRQYRLLFERFDPAKFESHGADFVKVAKDKREAVERAARSLLEQLGEKLEEEKKPEAPADIRHNPDLDAAFGM